MSADASARGRSNRRRGADAERRVAAWLSTHGWPAAVRAVRNTDPDPGDIAETHPALWWSIKDCQVEHVDTWLAEADAKSGSGLAVLVIRRRGHADPADWWAWCRLYWLAALLGAYAPYLQRADPVRLRLDTLTALLAAAGYTTEENRS